MRIPSLVISLALSLTLALPLSSCAKSNERLAHDMGQVAVLLEIETAAGKGHCSGTAVSQTVVLTATHCFPAPVVKLTINGHEVKAKAGIDDGSDHMLVVLDQPTFKRWAEWNRRAIRPGQEVAILGNPGDWRGVFRVGIVSGSTVSQDKKFEWILLDLPCFPGDSGGGLFDRRGRLVGMLSAALWQIDPRNGHRISMSGVIAFKFTDGQLAEAGLIQ